MRNSRLLVALVMGALAAGCGSTPKPAPEPNPNPQGGQGGVSIQVSATKTTGIGATEQISLRWQAQGGDRIVVTRGQPNPGQLYDGDNLNHTVNDTPGQSLEYQFLLYNGQQVVKTEVLRVTVGSNPNPNPNPNPQNRPLTGGLGIEVFGSGLPQGLQGASVSPNPSASGNAGVRLGQHVSIPSFEIQTAHSGFQADNTFRLRFDMDRGSGVNPAERNLVSNGIAQLGVAPLHLNHQSGVVRQGSTDFLRQSIIVPYVQVPASALTNGALVVRNANAGVAGQMVVMRNAQLPQDFGTHRRGTPVLVLEFWSRAGQLRTIMTSRTPPGQTANQTIAVWEVPATANNANDREVVLQLATSTEASQPR